MSLETITPEENYSTELIVYLLKYSLENETLLFSQFMELLDKEIALSEYEQFTISTQNTLSTDINFLARPDITIETEGEFFFIEVKVESGINFYSTENKQGCKEIINQIQMYQQIKTTREKNLYLLTKYNCDLPFDDCRDFKKKIMWQSIHQLLKNYESEDSVEEFLVTESKKYMEEKNMAIPKVSYELVNGMESLKNLLVQLRTALEGIPYKFGGGSTWVGFLLLLDKKQKSSSGWVGTEFDGSRLNFSYSDENAVKVIKSKYHNKYVEAGSQYETYFDFEENHFFCLKPEDQLIKLKKWIDENYKKLKEYSKMKI
jgi:hypothetical protein